MQRPRGPQRKKYTSQCVRLEAATTTDKPHAHSCAHANHIGCCYACSIVDAKKMCDNKIQGQQILSRCSSPMAPYFTRAPEVGCQYTTQEKMPRNHKHVVRGWQREQQMQERDAHERVTGTSKCTRRDNNTRESYEARQLLYTEIMRETCVPCARHTRATHAIHLHVAGNLSNCNRLIVERPDSSTPSKWRCSFFYFTVPGDLVHSSMALKGIALAQHCMNVQGV